MGEIIVENLGKAYKQYPSRWSRLKEWINPFSPPLHTLKWVLKDINFTIHSGEAVGIIGINGAGKSTLLKLITGTAMPTVGSVKLNGRVAALLELGMGFHPDFTGRQNVYMAGQLLGLQSNEISELMTEIEAFAEIGVYIDQPVRVYSSGMQMRLAFSIATAKRPDILIVDEALSVGDAYFQHKSIERIRKFRAQGTTLLLVSHDKQAIQSMCDTAILLKNGSVLLNDKPEVVMDYYNAILAEHQNQNINFKNLSDGRTQVISGSGEASITEITIRDSEWNNLDVVQVGQKVSLCINVKIKKSIEKLVLGYSIKDRLGQVIYGVNTFLTEQVLNNLNEGDEYFFCINFNANLGPGTYSIQTSLSNGVNHLDCNYEWRDLALVFNVVNFSKYSFAGSSWLPSVIELKKL